jgi:alpha-glucuronidase
MEFQPSNRETQYKTSRTFIAAVGLLLQVAFAGNVRAEDGYRLWLRYDQLSPQVQQVYAPLVSSLLVPGNSSTNSAILQELRDGCSGLLGRNIPVVADVDRDGTVLVGTPKSSTHIANLKWDQKLADLGSEGFCIRSVGIKGHATTVIASNGEAGALYGAFHFLRLLQTLQPIDKLDVVQKPGFQLRMLDHWDNLDGSIERGYAGPSLWKWSDLPDKIDTRLRDYARANASLGINGSILNNVNADAAILKPDYLRKVAAIAGVFRPFGIRVFLAARFSAPMELGGLSTADPLDAKVVLWWKEKADEVYRLIPDFGGFIVKANSEGQPGPRTYNRNHVDGANMLAAAVAPHNGVVIWRAFVYDMKPGYDRAGAAYENLHPFDGKFAANVLLQVKNGPIDFQPREPFHPLFGGMPHTQLVPEFQITQEYLGFSNHLVFLAQMWREVLDSDTYAKGPGSSVTRVVDGSLYGQRITGIAGVANTGSDRNWTGHHFAQANWYAFGRLAWDPNTPSAQIADEWIKMTLTREPKAVATIKNFMLDSYETLVNYMTPLGLHHLMWGKHHYGPAPWWDKEPRDDWNPVYFHRADATGLGFDRTASGSNSVSQYNSVVRDRFANLKTCPDEFLMWFHHVPWNYRMHSGRTMWDELALHYQSGVEGVRDARKKWESLSTVIDSERHGAVASKFAIQERDAIWWRDAVLLYFQSFSKLPLPKGVEPPAHSLDVYMEKSLNW